MLRLIAGICLVLLIIAIRTYQQDDFAWIDQSPSLRGGTTNPGRGRNLSSLNSSPNLGILDGGVVPEDEVHSTSTSSSVIGGAGGRMLRVPCSIAVNSSEATNRASSHAKTSMATYVDTGAQLTIISASAAKRSGIYHLMDRRYAGIAIGVGQSRILGRIPARHVYFLLGEGKTSANRVQMDGPALTVIEDMVMGIDILLGLDVLQDWDAEIRMGKQKSITIRKGREQFSWKF